MTESEKQELNGLLKERIEAGEILGHDRQGKGFICPKCGKNSKGETPEECKTRMGRDFFLDLR